VLYLLDANILITANSTYYPLDQIPEFWSWIQYQAVAGRVKIPREIMDEIKAGRQDDDSLFDWIDADDTETAFVLNEIVNDTLVQQVVSAGYAQDLRDDEVEKIGRDPFLVAYALADPTNRTVVTIETSRPSAQRANRKVPDVCQTVGVLSCGPFALNKTLGFTTGWQPST
jgi:hypothetical protein